MTAPGAVFAVIAMGVTPGQVTIEVKAGKAAPTGTAVCAHDTVAVVVPAPGVQLTPIAGALSPTVAGAVIVRLAFAVMA